jgi:hypothetical protein
MVLGALQLLVPNKRNRVRSLRSPDSQRRSAVARGSFAALDLMSNEVESQLERVVDRMSQEEFDSFMAEALGDPIYKRQLTLVVCLYVGVALGSPLAVAWSIQLPRPLAGRLVMFLMPIVALAVLYPRINGWRCGWGPVPSTGLP